MGGGRIQHEFWVLLLEALEVPRTLCEYDRVTIAILEQFGFREAK
jgi:hypothetical protein